MIDVFSFLKLLLIFCVPMTLFAPQRFALIVWLIVSNLDVSSADWQLRDSIGWENAIRILLIPAILLVRLYDRGAYLECARSLAFRAWVLLCVYVLLASLWSPHLISAIKMFGYMVSHSITFVAFYAAWSKGDLSERELTITIVANMLLGIIQTYVIGNIVAANMIGEDVSRFSTFVAPQAYAQYLSSMLILVWLGPGFGASRRLLLSALILAQLVLSGSRTYLFASIIATLIAVTYFIVRNLSLQRAQVALLTFTLVAFVNLSAIVVVVFAPGVADSSRAFDMITALSGGRSLSEIGTYGFRLSVWDATADELSRSSPAQILFGHGTSSAVDVARQVDHYLRETTFDGNRIFHNEYLRSLYEWGIAGASLLVSVLILILVVSMANIVRNRRVGYLGLCATMLIILSFSTENVLASSGNPGGIGLLLILSQLAQPARRAVGA